MESRIKEKFQYYNGNGPLMAAQRLVAAARDISQYDDEDVYAALRSLYLTNKKTIDYLLYRLNDETYDYYERHQ